MSIFHGSLKSNIVGTNLSSIAKRAISPSCNFSSIKSSFGFTSGSKYGAMEAKRLASSTVSGNFITPSGSFSVFGLSLLSDSLPYISLRKLRVNIRKIPQYR